MIVLEKVHDGGFDGPFPILQDPFLTQTCSSDEEMNNGSNFQQLARAQLTSFNCWAQKDSCVPNCTLQPLGYS